MYICVYSIAGASTGTGIGTGAIYKNVTRANN